MGSSAKLEVGDKLHGNGFVVLAADHEAGYVLAAQSRNPKHGEPYTEYATWWMQRRADLEGGWMFSNGHYCMDVEGAAQDFARRCRGQRSAVPGARDLLDCIHTMLDGKEWTPSSLEEIASLLTTFGGYEIRAPGEVA